MTTQTLSTAADLFAADYANAHFLSGGYTVETRGDVSVLKGSLAPYNESGVNSFIVVAQGDTLEIRAFGSVASDDVECSGFAQTSAKKTVATDGLTAAQLAAEIASLGKRQSQSAPLALAA